MQFFGQIVFEHIFPLVCSVVFFAFVLIWLVVVFRKVVNIEGVQTRNERRHVLVLVDQMIANEAYPTADVEFVLAFSVAQFWWECRIVDSPINQLVAKIRKAHADDSPEELHTLLPELRDRLIEKS